MNFALVAGATCIALSPIWMRLAEVGPTASAFWHRSIQHTSVANSTLLANLATVLVTMAAWLIWKQRPTRLLVAGLAAALAAAHQSGEPMLPQSLNGWLVLLGLAWVSHSAGQGLIGYSLAHLPAAFSSGSLLFQPVMAGVFAWLLLGESLVALQVAGSAAVLAGNWLARRGSKQDTPGRPGPLGSRAEP